MHWPSPFGRGDNMFPKDKDGKAIVGDSDYVDVWLSSQTKLEPN
jgi:alcohol dehydrogenase (NADP+)